MNNKLIKGFVFVLILVSTSTFFQLNLSAETHYKRVLTIGVNPVENGESLVEKFFGNSSNIENSTFNGAISRLNQIGINYTIARHINISEFPLLPNGNRVFNMNSYSKCVGGGTAQDIQNCDNSKWQFSYSKFFDDFNICSIANQENVDEIWILTPPYIGKWESLLVGPYEGFWINGVAEVNSNCNKLYPVMGPTYDRPENLLHNFGHRIESTIEYIFTNIKDEDKNTHWRRFSGFGGQPLGCGNTHFPRNYRYDYDYSNPSPASFNCPDWKNFPNYNGATINVGCNSWGCDDPGWERFWFSYIPSSSGNAVIYNTNNQAVSIKKDWWYYILNPQESIAFVNYSSNPGPLECSIFSYSEWSKCIDGTQTRTLTGSNPPGCTGGSPVLSQSCTVCYKYTYSNWGACINGIQKRFITQLTETNCPGEEKKSLEQSCSSINNPTGNTLPQSPEGNSQEPTPTVTIPTNLPILNTVPISYSPAPTLADILSAIIPGLKTQNTQEGVSYTINPSFDEINNRLVNLMAVLAISGAGLVIMIYVFLYSKVIVKRFKKA